MPENYPRPAAKYDFTFVGCGALFRTEAVRQVGGYKEFFECEWEEPEYALRMLKGGWAVFFLADILIHHHVSPLQRRSARTWSRGFRNKLWALVMHFPMRRLAAEGTWVLTLATWDAVRLLRPRQLARGIAQFIGGLPRAIRLREPMSRETMRLYDALRFRGVRSDAEFRSPPPCGLTGLWRHYWHNWLNRPRPRSVWDSRPGDVGSSDTVRFAHEFADRAKTASDMAHARAGQATNASEYPVEKKMRV